MFISGMGRFYRQKSKWGVRGLCIHGSVFQGQTLADPLSMQVHSEQSNALPLCLPPFNAMATVQGKQRNKVLSPYYRSLFFCEVGYAGKDI